MNKLIVWISIILFIISFSWFSIRRYQTLNSYYYDLGIMNQVVYNTSQGRFLEMSNPDLKRNVSRLAIHFDPILAVFAPFYKIYPGPEVLLIGQAVILGLGAWIIYLLAEKKLKDKFTVLIFSLTYLLYFPVQRVVLFDFHGVALATTFLLASIYFQETKKWHWFFIFIFLSLLTKEHIGLVVFIYGIYLFIIKKEKKFGLITGFLGLGFFISTVYFIIPYFRGEAHFASNYFVDIKLRLKSIILDGFPYVKSLILPNFYALFSPLTLLISLPEWAINILSINNNQRSVFFHYNSVIVPFVSYSSILGYRNFDNFVKNKKVKSLILILFILLTLKSAYLYNPIPYFVKNPVKYKELNPITKKSLKIWIEKLKDDKIRVSTTPKLAPFFTSRRFYHNFLFDSAYASMGLTDVDIIETIDEYETADYVIIYRPEIGNLDKISLPVKFYTRLKDDRNFQIVYSDDRNEKSIEVYKRI
ncbi:DUF2079 domain-containing protein [Candidatus Roizmanbacteria bacterium]|nr:DUF2079 domain-containing protein [Candidatus Roizmanbacteria bacterium]